MGAATLARRPAGQPTGLRARHDEVRRLQRAGCVGDAIALLRTLILEAPDHPRLRADLVVLLRLDGRHLEADRLAVELDPSDVATWARLSRHARRTLDHALFVEAAAGWQAAAPDDPVAAHFAEIAHQLVGGDGPARAGDGYLRTVFDCYSTSFDDHLAGLGYTGPDSVAGLVGDLVTDGDLPANATIADLGCGTGLVGERLRRTGRCVGPLVGVDLSAGMLARAGSRVVDDRPVYDELAEEEFETFLAGRPDAVDAVVAVDAFIYVGDLRPVVTAAATSLRPGGWLVATLERAVQPTGGRGWAADLTGRYVHEPAWVERVLVDAGFELVVVDDLSVRRERGRRVPGLVAVARSVRR